MLFIGLKPRGRPNVEHSLGLAEGTEEDRFEGTSGRTHASSKEGWLILQNWQNFTIHQGALYLCSMPKGETEDLLLFIVPKAHHVAALNRCHRDAGHQDCDCTLSLLREHFWWPEWLIRCNNPSSPVCIVCNMRAIYQKHLYTQLWPLLLWTSCM